MYARVVFVEEASQYIHVETKAMQGLNLFGEDSMMNRGRAFRYFSEEVHGQKQKDTGKTKRRQGTRGEKSFFFNSIQPHPIS